MTTKPETPSIYHFSSRVFVGRVNNPQVRQGNNGKPFLTFSMALNKGPKDAQETEWLNCITGDIAPLSKGDIVAVFGQPYEEEYNGKKQWKISAQLVIQQAMVKEMAAPVRPAPRAVKEPTLAELKASEGIDF